MIFRQLLDPETSTYTYLLADRESREAVLIDPVREQLPRDLRLLEELELTYALETHVHADHVPASGRLRDVRVLRRCRGLYRRRPAHPRLWPHVLLEGRCR